MKYCDNPECPYFKRVNKFAEYRDEFNTCSDCGSVLKSGDRPEIGIDDLDIDPLVNISSYRDLQDAYLAKGRLESEGVKVFLRNEHTIGVQWLYSTALGGVKLDVPESQVQQAVSILKEDHSEEITDQHLNGSSDINGTCPKCNSTNTLYYDRARKYSAISLMLSFPLVLFGKRYKCLDCNHIWKPK